MATIVESEERSRALTCTRGTCRNHKRLLCCVNYGCEYINC